MATTRGWLIGGGIVGMVLALGGIAVGVTLRRPDRAQPTSEPTTSQPVGPGPQNDSVFFGTTADPTAWSTGTKIAEHASVPDLIELTRPIGQFKAGDLLVYAVDFATVQNPGEETLALISSSDGGRTWSAKQTVTVAKKSNRGAPVDPSVIQLPDGTLRLYFFGSDVTAGDPAAAPGPHHVYSATSSDGVNFTTEPGSRFARERLTDPEVIAEGDRWLMVYSLGPTAGLAASSDGLTFTDQAITGGEVGGVPGAVAVDGGIRLFGCAPGGIASAFATDDVTFRTDTRTVFSEPSSGLVCDPTIVSLQRGGYAFVYKQGQPLAKRSQPIQPQPSVPR